MRLIEWAEFEQIAKNYIGGVIYADESPIGIHVGIIDKITFDHGFAKFMVPVTRRLVSETQSEQSLYSDGWGASMSWGNPVLQDDGTVEFSIYTVASVTLYPPGHELIQGHWLINP